MRVVSRMGENFLLTINSTYGHIIRSTVVVAIILPAHAGLFNEENVPWLLDMLKNDVFHGQEKITKGQFMEVRGDSPDKNAFWRVVSQIAVEKFNMKEVFDMRSTVRLAAIEKLCKCTRSVAILYNS